MSLKRHELRKLSNEKHRNPLNTTLREKYHIVLQQYKKLLAHKRNEYYNNKLSELEDITYNLDTKKFWNCLKSMDDTIKYKDTPPIAEENWMNYFQCLHSISSVCILIRTREDILMQSRPLHYFITLIPVHHKLFNTVLNLGTAPKNWCNGLITPIFKSGVRNDPLNYRWICVSSCLGKHVTSLNILHKSQIGFLLKN